MTSSGQKFVFFLLHGTRQLAQTLSSSPCRKGTHLHIIANAKLLTRIYFFYSISLLGTRQLSQTLSNPLDRRCASHALRKLLSFLLRRLVLGKLAQAAALSRHKLFQLARQGMRVLITTQALLISATRRILGPGH